MDSGGTSDEAVEVGRRPGGWARATTIGLTAIGLFLTINHMLLLLPAHLRPGGNAFYYFLIACFMPVVFLTFPARKQLSRRPPGPIDWGLAIIAGGCGLYFGIHARDIMTNGWDMTVPLGPTVVSGVLFVLSIEAARRTAGIPLAIVCLVFGLYPLVADRMPGVLWGNAFDLPGLLAAHAMGAESIVGAPFRVVANLLVGYLVFGVALTVAGGGEFFMRLALALLGRTRGGPAKVAVMASALFGSLSGSVVSNILTTGTFTIPSMKRGGYSPEYASAVEACASTGGTLMPPIMGTAAFLMAEFLGVPYATVLTAAIIPSLLFYGALALQTDCQAASEGLVGLPDSEIPRLWDVLKSGWPFMLALAALIYVLLGMRLEVHAPWVATVVLLVSALFPRGYRRRIARVDQLLSDSGAALAQLTGILAGVGLVVGALSITGVGSAFARELLQYAGGNVYLLLFFGALTSFVLGMGMTVSACYIFLAVILGPALVRAGLDPVASHLYILYWGMLSNITPPVAIAAITAATVGRAAPMKTSLLSMRLGFILFIVPVIFVLDPALVARAPFAEVAVALVTAAFSIVVLSCSISGWLYGVGRVGPLVRVPLGGAGLLTLVPGLTTDAAGFALALIVAGAAWLRARFAARATAAAPGIRDAGAGVEGLR